jgi:hypothetical protein
MISNFCIIKKITFQKLFATHKFGKRWSRPVLGPTQPPIQWVFRAPSPGIKQQKREADHSPPTSAEVKNMWIYTSTPPYVFVAWCLIS